MASTNKLPEENGAQGSRPHPSAGHARVLAGGLGIAIAAAAIGYMLLSGFGLSWPSLTIQSSTTQADKEASDRSLTPSKPEIHLTRESIDLLLDALDQAMRRKEIDGVLRHLAPDATITIHMRQGASQQIATLSREEYGKTLAMEFAFPSANDFTRTNTTVSLAPDERSAKVSFKSTETLRQDQREFTIEGETTLVVKIREDRVVITALEQVVPGDST